MHTTMLITDIRFDSFDPFFIHGSNVAFGRKSPWFNAMEYFAHMTTGLIQQVTVHRISPCLFTKEINVNVD
jgi:hypothetical protein